jgi:hypothetical protein
MYPTVNSLMDLWRFVTAHKITIVEHCHREIEVFLQQLNANTPDLDKPCAELMDSALFFLRYPRFITTLKKSCFLGST